MWQRISRQVGRGAVTGMREASGGDEGRAGAGSQQVGETDTRRTSSPGR